ncbi:MAG: tRNA (guanosine(37)-N1)-methyltransferase TrmD [Bacteroidota bacterium]
MRFDILTVVPGLLESPFSHSIVQRAIRKELVEIHVHNVRDYANDRHRTVDDYPYGGGAGMVMMVEPVVKCMEKLKSEREYDQVIYMSPDGDLFDQNTANGLSLLNNVMILCGHYKGIDERIREHFIDREISIGNYVLSGGELAAAVICDAVVRLLPGAIGDETSALSDSFQDGLVAPPTYTRPADFRGWKVPDILLSGNIPEIERWRYEQAVERTSKRRPEL